MILHTLLIVYPLVNSALHGQNRTTEVVLTAKNTNSTVLHSAKSLQSLASIVPRTLTAFQWLQ